MSAGTTHCLHMTTIVRPTIRLLALTLVCLVPCSPAYAYIDPNAGGMLFQLLAPVFAAIVGAWLFLRRWIIDFVQRLIRKFRGRADE